MSYIPLGSQDGEAFKYANHHIPGEGHQFEVHAGERHCTILYSDNQMGDWDRRVNALIYAPLRAACQRAFENHRNGVQYPITEEKDMNHLVVLTKLGTTWQESSRYGWRTDGEGALLEQLKAVTDALLAMNSTAHGTLIFGLSDSHVTQQLETMNHRSERPSGSLKEQVRIFCRDHINGNRAAILELAEVSDMKGLLEVCGISGITECLDDVYDVDEVYGCVSGSDYR